LWLAKIGFLASFLAKTHTKKKDFKNKKSINAKKHTHNSSNYNIRQIIPNKKINNAILHIPKIFVNSVECECGCSCYDEQ
jgi:hypothetical protein